MPGVPAHLPGGGRRVGGIVGYPLESLYEEVAFVAYHFHWSLADILALEHGDRQRFVERISTINREMNEASQAPPPSQGIPLQHWR